MRISLLSLFFLFFTGLSAQDLIQLVSGEELHGKVLEVGDEIRYRQADFPDGPVYVVYRQEVAMITYSNGREEFFNVQFIGGQNGFAVRENYLRIRAGNRFFEGFRLISRQEFEGKLQRVPGVFEEYERGRKLQTAGYVVSGAGLLIATVGSIPGRRNDFSPNNISISSSIERARGRFTALGAGLTVLLGGGIILASGTQKISRAVDNYNISLTEGVGLQPSVTENGLGLTVTF